MPAGPTRLGALAAAGLLFAGSAAAESNARLDASAFDDTLNAAAAMPRLRSLLISHDGEIAVEQYFGGARPGDTFNVKSVSKTFMSALVGAAIDQGHIEGLEQPISDFYGELLTDEDPRKSDITIGNLLSMQAGLETTSFYNYGAWVVSDDWVRFALEQPVVADPGTKLLYSTGNSHLLSAILTEATGQPMLRFARESLAQPIDIEIAAWDRAPDGVYFGGNNMAFTPRAMMAFGHLYMNDGRYGNRQVLPSEWVELSTTPRVESPREPGRYYGYGWWIRNMGGFESPYAWGYGGQFIVLVPELDLVVVTTSSPQPGDGRRSHIRDLYSLIEYGAVVEAADALGEFRPIQRRPISQPMLQTD